MPLLEETIVTTDTQPQSTAATRLVLPWPCLIPAVATGVLLWLCHFPVAWGWLGWVALVPLLTLIRSDARPRRIYLSAWLGGLVFFVPVLQWLRVADPRMYGTWVMLSLHCSLFVPLAILFIRRLDRTTPLPLTLSVPLVWTALEFLRAHLLGGFPWYFLAHTQHDLLPVIQVSDLAGAYAVTFLVAAVNALVFEWLFAFPRFRTLFALPDSPRRLPIPQTAFVALLLVATLSYGFWRLGQTDFETGPRVALIQGNMPQGVRNEAFGEGGNAADQMFNHFNLLGAVAARRPPKPDLIAWPETSLPEEFSFTRHDVPKTAVTESWERRLEEMPQMTANAVKYWPANLLMGVNTAELQPDGHVRRYNSGLLIREDGTVGGRYDKMHRVPFGEYVPLRDLLPFMNWLAPYDFEYSVSAGEHFTRFPLGKYHFGVVICYEDTDPTLARQYVTETTEGPKVDFLVNISNDGWFDGTAEHEEHLAISRFRAVESRRAVLRAVNMGVSAVVDGNGRVLAPELQAKTDKVQCWEATPESPSLPIGRWAEFKKVAGVLSAVVPIDHRDSFYAMAGDWLPWGCWMLLAVGLCWGYAGGKRS